MDEEKPQSGNEAGEQDPELETRAETRVVKPLSKAELGLLIGVPPCWF